MTTAGSVASAQPAASGSADAKAPPGTASSWTGTYKAAKGTLFVPDGGEWSGVKWRGDDGTAGIGEGSMTMTIDASGLVSGTASGALGDLTLSGIDRNGDFSATLRPTDPNGFSGTFIGTQPKDGTTALEGTMHLADAQNKLLRVATVSLTRK